MAFVKEINPSSEDSHQTSPGYVLTFLRWSNRSTFYYKTIASSQEVRRPLVVYNDAINVKVTNSKAALTPTMTAVLKAGDINYSTAIHPGDFILVNMLNWESDAELVRNRAISLQPINRYEDGFKGVFKVQNVVRNVSVDPKTGTKSQVFTITGAGFTEFNNVINYNPAIVSAFSQAGTSLYQNQIGNEFANLLKAKVNIQDITRILFKILLGQSRKTSKIKEVQNYGNTHFKVPSDLGRLLGVNEATYAVDVFNFIIGIWKKTTNIPSDPTYKNFNQSMSKITGDKNFYETGTPIQGVKEVKLEDWNQKTAWSILMGYSNQTLNEMYTTYRLSPDGDRVMPTVVLRQKPLNNLHYRAESEYPVSNHLEMPRWKISSDLLKSLQLSKNEAARFNFVQVFTQTIPGIQKTSQAFQIAAGNFQFDKGDIERNGLRPYIKSSPFNFLSQKDLKVRAVPWSKIVTDWIIDGHLRESGTLTFVGLQDPISVGDNLEFDGVVYHIEAISHDMSVAPSGIKTFKTTLTVSHGIDKRSNKVGPVYPEMEHTDAHTKNIEDFKFERINPGISDTQNIIGRVDGEEVNETKQKSFTDPTVRSNRRD